MNQKLLFAIFGITVLGHYSFPLITFIGLGILLALVILKKIKLYEFKDLSALQKTLIKATYFILMLSGIVTAIKANWTESLLSVFGALLLAGFIYISAIGLNKKMNKQLPKKLLFDFYMSFCLFVPMYLFLGTP